MKKTVLGIAAIAALIGTPALAADIPYKVPPPPASSWTGCYLNGGFGYGLWSREGYGEFGPPLSTTFVPDGPTGNSSGRGWLGTVGGGCDYQVGSRFVVGAFGDYDFMNLSGNVTDSFAGFGMTANTAETGAWAAGGRVGYLFTPMVLGYVNAGWTQARFSGGEEFVATLPPGDLLVHLASQTFNGWFIGGGSEMALGWLPGLYWRNEYRFSSYSAKDVPWLTTPAGLIVGGVPVPAGTPLGIYDHTSPYVQTISTSLVWRFNWGSPCCTR